LYRLIHRIMHGPFTLIKLDYIVLSTSNWKGRKKVKSDALLKYTSNTGGWYRVITWNILCIHTPNNMKFAKLSIGYWMTVLLFRNFGSYSINITILTPKNQRKLQNQMKKKKNLKTRWILATLKKRKTCDCIVRYFIKEHP